MDVACLSPSELFDYCPVAHRVSTDLADAALDFHDFQPHEGDVPTGTGYDAALVMGSKYHVYDDRAWIDETQEFLVDALEAGIPVLGVCFGHQLLAAALGGTVEKMDQREIGYNEIRLTDHGRRGDLFRDVPDPFTTFTTHQDRVARLPGADTLAENRYGIQAYRHRDLPAYGIQFHPEYSLDMARTLADAKDLDEERREELHAGLTEERADDALPSRRVFRNFFDRIA